MRKHKLLELTKIIEERIGSLIEEVEIATIVKLNSLYIVDRTDEILDRMVDSQQQLGVSKIRLESEDTKKFGNMIHDKIQELEIELEDSSSAREREVLPNEIDTLKCVLDHLFKLNA
jgi:transcription initiation factor IIE alpha subunit